MAIVVKVRSNYSKYIDKLKNAIDAPQTKAEAHEVLRDISDPYVPYDTGKLSQNVTVSDKGVTYNQPYARRVFYGDWINFHKDKHPLATARWTDVAIMNNREEFNTRVKNVITEAINNANK